MGDAWPWGAARGPARAGGKFGGGRSAPVVSFGEIIPSGKGCAVTGRAAGKRPERHPRGPRSRGGSGTPRRPRRRSGGRSCRGSRWSPESGERGGGGGGEGGSAGPCPVRAAPGVDGRRRRSADLLRSQRQTNDFDARWGGGEGARAPPALPGPGAGGPAAAVPLPARIRPPVRRGSRGSPSAINKRVEVKIITSACCF